jgi:hypothetical protein
MRNKYCDQESVFEHIWKHADRDGLWDGDAASVAENFGVTEVEAHCALGNLADRRLIEELVPGKYAIVKWPERDNADKEELS